MPTIAIVDGSNMIFRSFFAVKELKTSQGFPTNAIYGSLKSLRSVINQIKPDYIIVCWDSGKKSFRNEIDPNYKAHRPPVDSNLKVQFAPTQEAFKLMGIPQITAPAGVECDDIIGTIAKQASAAGINTVIVSSDKDFFQLCDNHIQVYSFNVAKKDGIGLVDYNYVVREFGVNPDQLVHVKSLTGEKTDNIPGVRGIGPKTATALIQEHGTVTALLSHLELNKNHKNFYIYECIETVQMALELAIIKTDVEIQEIPVKPVDTIESDGVELRKFFEQYEMTAFLSEFNTWQYLFRYKTTV